MILFSVYPSPFYRFDIIQADFTNEVCAYALQSYGLIVKDQKFLIVHNGPGGHWTPPGGTIEQGETPIDCLVREVYEESAVILDETSIQSAFYQKVYHRETKESEYKFVGNQLRYIALPHIIEKFQSDPAGTVDKIKWVEFEKLESYINWGKTTELIINILHDK